MTPKLSPKEDLSLLISGTALPHAQVLAALTHCGDSFTKDQFDAALRQACGSVITTRMAGRGLQALKRKGVVWFEPSAQRWRRSAQGSASVTYAMSTTLPLRPLPTFPHIPAKTGARLDRITEAARLMVGGLSCTILLVALIGLNASFAWELGREAAQFQILFTMGVMALDMMRPGFVAAGLFFLTHSRRRLGAFALLLALVLSPVSVLSTTSILSASFLLGDEFNVGADSRAATREALRGEHARLLAQAEQAQAAWKAECARGGCGPVAAELEAAFRQTLSGAQAVLDRIVVLTEADQNGSELLARMVTTFEGLGLFGDARQMLLPLFLALSLELGALFGPAVLLRRRRP